MAAMVLPLTAWICLVPLESTLCGLQLFHVFILQQIWMTMVVLLLILDVKEWLLESIH